MKPQQETNDEKFMVGRLFYSLLIGPVLLGLAYSNGKRKMTNPDGLGCEAK